MYIFTEWGNLFKQLEYHKIFPNKSDDEYRHNIYLRNLRKVNDHNKLYNKHIEPFKLGINQYSDMESEEVMHLYTGVGSSNSFGRVTPPDIDRDHSYEFVLPNRPFEIPRSLNWVLEGAVTPIKSQGKFKKHWIFHIIRTYLYSIIFKRKEASYFQRLTIISVSFWTVIILTKFPLECLRQSTLPRLVMAKSHLEKRFKSLKNK